MDIKSTEYGCENTGDRSVHNNSSRDVQLRTGSAGPSRKESNTQNVLLNNIRYRQTLFTYTGGQSNQLFCNQSLPDQATLQNVYLRRGNSDTGIHRHYSTGDVRTKKENHDASSIENYRKWIPTHHSTNPMILNSSGLEFKLMNYNVLAQDLVTEHAFIYRKHSPAALLWENRWRNLYKEISEHNADIICLQEVQEGHINKYYNEFKKLGYGSIFKKRTGYRTDGCALYYREDMFTLVDYITVEYLQPNITLLNRENVAIIVILAPKLNPDAKFVVATTHLLYNPKRQDIRVAQTQILLTEVERMAFKKIDKNDKPEYYPVIITGDFNSVPESAVFQFITKGKLNYENLPKRTLTPKMDKNAEATGKELIPSNLRITDQCQHLDLLNTRYTGKNLTREQQESYIYLGNSEKMSNILGMPKNESLFSTGVLSHNFNLKSAFRYRVGNDTEGTTYQNAWITVDYIFYSTEECNKNDGRLKLMSRYSIPTTAQLQTVRTIPNFVLGSDHLALLSKFKLEF